MTSLHQFHTEDTDDLQYKDPWDGDPHPDVNSLQRTDDKKIRPRKHDTGHSYTGAALKEDWSLLMDSHAESDLSLPSPMKPVACPRNKITANKTGREFDIKEPDIDLCIQSSINVGRATSNCKVDSSDRRGQVSGFEYANTSYDIKDSQGYRVHGYGTEVLFEDVVSQYVSVDDGAVAYPMPFFTSPKTPQWQRKSRKDEELELYEGMHNIGRSGKSNVTFGEGLPDQSFNYEDVRATVILPPTPRRTSESSMCRDRDCNLRADPDSNGFCIAHSRELQGMFVKKDRNHTVRNEKPRSVYTEMMDKEDRRTPTLSKYQNEPPGESPRPIEGHSAGSRSTESHTQKRTYGTSPPGNSLTMQDEPKRQMKTQKTQTRNVGHQPGRKQAPAAPARPVHRTSAPVSPPPEETIEQEISEAELERDYADMVNNIIAVSKIATKKCRQPKCDNFGNEKSKWFCNGCYKNISKQQQSISSIKQKEAERLASREEQQRMMQAKATGYRAQNKFHIQTRPAAREKTTPAEGTPDQDMRKLHTQAPHQCKIFGCRNYASKAGYCNACFNT